MPKARKQSSGRKYTFGDYIPSLRLDKKITPEQSPDVIFGDPYENRTRVSAVKGPCLNRLTNGPYVVAEAGFEPATVRV